MKAAHRAEITAEAGGTEKDSKYDSFVKAAGGASIISSLNRLEFGSLTASKF